MKHLTIAFNGTNQWWKYLVLFLASLIGGQTVGAIPLIIVILTKTLQGGVEKIPNPENMADLSVFGIDPNFGLALMIFPFLVSLVILLLLVKPMHQRNYKTLFSGGSLIRWKRFFSAALIWTLLMAVYLFTDYSLNPEDFSLNFNLGTFLVLLVVSLTLIPFQASYEEIMFRGYLAQGFAAWTKNRIMVIFFPAIIFGMLHIFNPEISEYGFWLAMPQYILFGVIFGLVSVLDDGIELAMGAHTANNVFLSLFVTSKASALQTPALFIQENIDPLKDLLVMILVGLLFIIIVSLRYGFKYAILYKKISVEAEIVQ